MANRTRKAERQTGAGGASPPPPPGITLPVTTIPRGRLGRICDTIQQLAPAYLAAKVNAANKGLAEHYGGKACQLAKDLDRQVAECLRILAAYTGQGSSQEAEVIAALEAVASCCRPGDGQEEFEARMQRLELAGRRLRGAMEAVPIRPLVEALEHAESLAVPPEPGAPQGPRGGRKPRRSRLTIDQKSNCITLDGVCYSGLDPDALAVFKALWKAKANGENRAIPFKKLQELLPHCNHENTLRRQLDKLPEPLRSCVKAEKGKGRWLALPPLS
jgi:hypothetical protein